MITFGIPCKNDETGPILACVNNILKLHEGADIQVVVVDSGSENRSYMPTLEEWGVMVADIQNPNYETGAWWHVYNNYPSDYYCFLHDSLILLQPILDCLDNNITTVAYSEAWHWAFDEEIAWGYEQLAKTNFEFKEQNFTSIFGSMFMCKAGLMDQVAHKGFNNILPWEKGHSRAMERLWGLAFTELGYEKELRQNALYGPIYDILMVRNSRVDKMILRRV